jgi:peptidyl-prolyl cis-trans isomerase C
MLRPWLAAVVLGWTAWPAFAQQPPVKETLHAPTPAARSVAATVNGQPIYEAAVQRGLKRVPPDKHAEARTEILDVLVENVLVEQYLKQMRIAIEDKDIDKRIEEMKAEFKKQNVAYDEFLKEMGLSEAEVREHVTAELRWEKFVDGQATDPRLRSLFDSSKEMFDGSMVRVRHILLSPEMKNPQAVETAKGQLAGFKKQIEAKVAEGLAKLPATADNLAREKERIKLIDAEFAAIAKDKSTCPSKNQGGDVGWFDRAGNMVEPFAKAAFALKAYQMSDIVQTQFGFHLLLLLDRKPGKEVKFDEVKNDVKEVYGEKLREAVVAQMRKTAKVELAPKQ